MKHCKTCKRWEKDAEAEFGHKCKYISEDDRSGWTYGFEGDYAYLDYDKFIFMPGPDYGCVHHKDGAE